MIRYFLFLSTFLTSAAWAQEPTSFYSTTAQKFIATLQSSAFEENPDIDYFHAVCPGYGGYELIFEGGDARSWLNVKYGSTISDLRRVTMDAAEGTFPQKANDVVEWRGIVRDETFVPYAIIYRVEAGKPESETDETFTKLLVIELNKGNANLLGTLSGENEGEQARALADERARRN
ncbi:MAG: hypothetical protein ACFCU3_04780 [Verrucomicrobiales bacterium]